MISEECLSNWHSMCGQWDSCKCRCHRQMKNIKKKLEKPDSRAKVLVSS